MKFAPIPCLLALGGLIAAPHVRASAQSQSSLPASALRVISVTATGSQRYTPEQIAAASGLAVGQMASEDDFRHAAQELGDTGAFRQVAYSYQYSATGTKLEFQVVDAKQFVPARFDNFVWFSDQDLVSKIQTAVPLFEGQLPVTGNLADQVSNALQGMVIERNVQGRVDYIRSAAPDGPISAILFSVTGPEIVIRDTHFAGAGPAELSSLQEAAKALAGEDYLRSILRAQVAKDFLPVYLARGYLKAAFGEPDAKIVNQQPNQITVDVTFPVTPGQQFKLTGVDWTGNKLLPASSLQPLLHEKPGEPLNSVRLGEDLRAVSELYGTRGYVAAVVHPMPYFDDAASTVSYQLQVHEGDLYHMGDLEIQGLEQNATDRLLLAWQLHKGDTYDSSYAQRFVHEALLNQLVTGGWNISIHQSPDLPSKTVDVTLRFDPKLTP